MAPFEEGPSGPATLHWPQPSSRPTHPFISVGIRYIHKEPGFVHFFSANLYLYKSKYKAMGLYSWFKKTHNHIIHQ